MVKMPYRGDNVLKAIIYDQLGAITIILLLFLYYEWNLKTNIDLLDYESFSEEFDKNSFWLQEKKLSIEELAKKKIFLEMYLEEYEKKYNETLNQINGLMNFLVITISIAAIAISAVFSLSSQTSTMIEQSLTIFKSTTTYSELMGLLSGFEMSSNYIFSLAYLPIIYLSFRFVKIFIRSYKLSKLEKIIKPKKIKLKLIDMKIQEMKSNS